MWVSTPRATAQGSQAGLGELEQQPGAAPGQHQVADDGVLRPPGDDEVQGPERQPDREGHEQQAGPERVGRRQRQDRKSTRLNSSHANISYAVFCLKKKINTPRLT